MLETCGESQRKLGKGILVLEMNPRQVGGLKQFWKAKGEEAKIKQVKAKAAQHLVEVEKKAKSEAIRQAQLELARQAVLEMSNPLDEMLNGLRERMYQSTKTILANVQKHNRVVGKQVEAIQNMISLFRMLNSAGDAELESKIAGLAQALEVQGLGTKRDAGAIMSALNDVAGVAMTEASTIIDQTEYTVWDALEF
jgi:hypothetical protein